VFGYIGSVINHILIQAGFDVIGLDAGFFSEDCFYREDVWQSRTRLKRLIRKDIRDISQDDMQGCDAVVDFAGLANDPSGDLNPVWTDEINHQACVRLAQLAKKREITRYIFASSCSIYGARGDTLLTEQSEVAPVSEYAKAKAATEHDIHRLASKEFFPTFLRNATAFGASPRMRFDLVINNLAAYGYTTGIVKIMSDGTAWRPNVHIEDIAHAVLVCLESPVEEVGDQIFNVGIDSENRQVSDLASIVSEIMSGCKIEFAKGGTKDPRSYKVSFSKISKLHRYHPQWDTRKGVHELKAAFGANGLTYKTFQGAKYHNVRRIQELIALHKFDDTLRLRT